jgi:hypothetical protein
VNATRALRPIPLFGRLMAAQCHFFWKPVYSYSGSWLHTYICRNSICPFQGCLTVARVCRAADADLADAVARDIELCTTFVDTIHLWLKGLSSF